MMLVKLPLQQLSLPLKTNIEVNAPNLILKNMM